MSRHLPVIMSSGGEFCYFGDGGYGFSGGFFTFLGSFEYAGGFGFDGYELAFFELFRGLF